MEKKYNEVPDMITGKDLDYLSDIFEWNIEAFKKVCDYKNKVKNQDICKLFNKIERCFDDNINITLDILSSGGCN